MISDGALGAMVAIVSYAIGTTQFLLVDWRKARKEHAQQLRTVQAHLRRLSHFDKKFGISPDLEAQKTNQFPRLPMLSGSFIPTVASINFRLTDAHSDDNAQEALIGIEDELQAMHELHARVDERLPMVREATTVEAAAAALERVCFMSDAYDERVDFFLCLVESALDDLDRRLMNARFFPQLRRTFTRLGKGENPPPLTRGDPRIEEARKARER